MDCHPFPFLNNKDIYYMAQLRSKNDGVCYGIVPVIASLSARFFIKDGEETCFAFVEELVAHYAGYHLCRQQRAEAVSLPRDPQCGYYREMRA